MIGARNIAITLCATFGTALYSFTWNSVTVALPHMQGAFSATTDQITWLMIGFVIGSSVMTASVGWLSDQFGRRRVFLITIAGYTATLLGCGQATTLEEAVLWRITQGAFGAGLIPLGQAIAVSAFPRDRHSQATSLWALGFVTSNVVAPTIAGVIIEDHGWQWIFYGPLPIGIAVLVASYALVPERERNPRRIDGLSFSTLILGVGTLQLMLARGERLDWFESTEIVVEAVVTVVCLYVFLIRTFTTDRPFVDRALFRDRDFNTGLTFIFMVGGVLFLPLILLPLLLQQIGGYSAIDTGYLMLSRGFGTILSLLLISRIRDRTDPRPLLAFGLGVTALATWSMSTWTIDILASDVIWTSFAHGLATGAIWAPLNTLTLSRLPPKLQDQGFALFYLSFDIGSAIGTAAVIGLHAQHIQINRAFLTEQLTPFTEIARTAGLPEVWSMSEPVGLAALEVEVSRQATMIAFNNSFMVVAITLAALIPFIVTFRYRRGAAASEG